MLEILVCLCYYLSTHKEVFFFGGIFVKKIKSFFKGIKKEAKAIRWPDGKNMVKYSCITVVMLIFFGLFFYASDALFALIRGLL